MSNSAWSQSGRVEMDVQTGHETEEPQESDNESEYTPYFWMFDSHNEHRLEKLLDVQRMVEEMPETISTFYPSDRLDWWTGEDHERAMLEFAGFWMLPDRFQQGEISRWVNYNNKWSDKYSDVAAICDCGAVKYTTDNRSTAHGYSQEHEDDCTPQATLQTKIEVWDNRDRIMREAAHNCLGSTYLYQDRIGTTKKGLRRIEAHLGFSLVDELAEGYRTFRATLVELNEGHEISGQKLGDAFGMSDGTVYKHINGEQAYYE